MMVLIPLLWTPVMLDDGKFYPLSDKAQVEFDIPDDYNDYNQEPNEIEATC